VELIERAAEIGARHGVGIVDHIEDRIVGLKVRDIYEAPAAAIMLPAHHELERLVCTIHQNQFKAQLDHQWAYLVYAGLWWEPLRGDLDAYMDSVNARHRHDRDQALQGPRSRRHALLAQRGLRRQPRLVLGVGRPVLPERPRPASSSCGRCSRGWPGDCATSRSEWEPAHPGSIDQVGGNGYKIIGYVVWKGGKWYLRKRLPSARRVALIGAGAAGGLIAATALAKRLAS
jgi:hypothetical protein